MVRTCVLPQVALWGKGEWSTESDNTRVSTIMIDVSKHFAATKIAIGDYLQIEVLHFHHTNQLLHGVYLAYKHMLGVGR